MQEVLNEIWLLNCHKNFLLNNTNADSNSHSYESKM